MDSTARSLTRAFALLLTGCCLLAPAAMAQGGAVALAKDCAVDLNQHCAAITPGEGRKVACLIAHSDKIAPRCRLSAFLAGKALAENMLRLERLAFKCSADIPSLCHKAGIGGGRIYDCLKKNKVRLVPECRNALPQFEAQFLRK